MPAMNDWFRSLAVLGAAFAGAVVITFGLAVLIVPGLAGSAQGPDPASSGDAGVDETDDPGGIPGLGGSLAVTGDREDTFRLTRENNGERYSLEGDEGRITFERRPVEITQISFDGLEFFPEPDACTITPGNLDNRVGIGFAELRCADLADIRDTGTFTFAGTIGMPLDMIAESDLPNSGGSVDVGGETWQFAEALLFGFQRPAVVGNPEYNMVLTDEERGGVINFLYDHETHRLTLANVARGDESVDVAGEACELREREIGRHNPRTAVIELSIRCAGVEVPGLGPVAISGTITIDRIEFPD